MQRIYCMDSLELLLELSSDSNNAIDLTNKRLLNTN